MRLISKRIITDLAGTSPYLVRWSLRLPFGWTLKLHWIVRPDDDRCTHDHPWDMLRIILWGGYWESRGVENIAQQLKPWRPWAPWRVYWCPANTFRHRITSLPRGASLTLALCSPKRRDWGFFTTSGWMQWKAFVNASRSSRVLWCDDGRTLEPVQGGDHV